MEKESVTRYVRPEDIPDLDDSILQTVLQRVAAEMTAEYPDLSQEEWSERLHGALLNGEILLVIDDRNRRLGLVRSDEHPFSTILQRPQTTAPIRLVDLAKEGQAWPFSE